MKSQADIRLEISLANRRDEVGMNSQAVSFFEEVQLGNSRIQYPETVIFLCGGQIGTTSSEFISLRHYLLKNPQPIFSGFKVVLAETASNKFDARIYDDLLSFEKDIASISNTVFLISESPGSIAELGAFSQITEISEKMFVIMNTQHYNENSFIKDGPVRFLENLDEESVQEFEWSNISPGCIDPSSADLVRDAIRASLTRYARKKPKTEKFNSSHSGHLILLVAGIVCMLRICKIREIKEHLAVLDIQIQENRLKRYLFCLTLFGWVKKLSRDTVYYVYIADQVPFEFRSDRGRSSFDNLRWRYLIASNYRSSDPRISVLRSLK